MKTGNVIIVIICFVALAGMSFYYSNKYFRLKKKVCECERLPAEMESEMHEEPLKPQVLPELKPEETKEVVLEPKTTLKKTAVADFSALLGKTTF